MVNYSFNQDLICDCIFNGWRRFEDFIYNTQDENDDIYLGPEYLATVKIAEELKQKISQLDLSLILEDRTNKTFTRRFDYEPVKGKSGIIYKGERKDYDSNNKKGRFDIVVYEKRQTRYARDVYKTKCVIEVKNFEKNKKRHKEDMNRIREVLTNVNKQSSIEFGILTFSSFPKKTRWDEIDQHQEQAILTHNSHIKKVLNLDENTDLKSMIISKRYSDIESPYIIYLFIVSCIVLK